MIVVKVELWKKGRADQVETLAQARIINDGTGTAQLGNYDVELLDKGGKAWRRGRVEGHRRLDVSVWRLVVKAVLSVLGKPKTRADQAQKELSL